MVARDGVEQLGARTLVELPRTLLDEPQAEVDVPQQAAFLRDLESRARLELARATDVMKERGGEQQVGARPGMELHELPADRGDTDRVLEQAAGVHVMRLG